MLTQHIALVPEADGVDPSELARVSAALQKQVTRDLSPIWGIAATVDAFPYLEDVPVGYWPIIVGLGDLGSQAGIHVDRNGQPYGLVQAGKGWSLAASRACLEMLVNPFENRTISAPSLRSDQAPVEFLIEVCGPCEDGRHAYSVNGVVVSDFCTPAFFGAKDSNAERFSWTGALTQALRVTPGGHVTWYDPITGGWWLRSHWGENPMDTQIGAVDRKLFSVRELVQACAPLRVAPKSMPYEAFEGRAAQARQASIVNAQRLRSLLGGQLESELDAAVDAVLLRRAADGSHVASQRPVHASAPFKSAVTVVEAKAPPAPPPDDDDADVEVILEIEGDGDYDFECDEPTLSQAPAYAAEPAVEQSVRSASERPSTSPPPFPASPRGSAQASRPARERVPSMPAPAPTTLAPIAMPIRPEAPSHRGRSQFVGGALGVAGLLAVLWAGRNSLTSSAESDRQPARAALGTAAPVVPPPAAVVAPPAVAIAPPAAVVAEPTALAEAAQTAQARPVAPAHAPTPAPTHAHRHTPASSVSSSPPVPVASQSAPARSAHDSIVDLLDTRR